MWKFIFFLLILLSVISKKTDDKDKILWSEDRKLKWEDFRGEPHDSLEVIVALIQGSIEIVEVNTENEIPQPIVHCYFIKSQSWTKVNDDYTLSHEQLHFDIYEIYARKIRKAFLQLNRRKIKQFVEYQSVYDKYIIECSEYNALYDSQSYFSHKKQEEWNKKVQLELKRLSEFSLDDN